MKVTIIMLMSANGEITRGDGDDLSWGGRLDKRSFAALTKEVGVVIMGRKTFAEMSRPLPKRKNIVMTRSPAQAREQFPEAVTKGVEFTSSSPSEILETLKTGGYSEAVVMGGGQINSLFLAENLVNHLRLTLAPALILPTEIDDSGRPTESSGKGIFAPFPESQDESELYRQLELIDTETYSDGAIVLTYKILSS